MAGAPAALAVSALLMLGCAGAYRLPTDGTSAPRPPCLDRSASVVGTINPWPDDPLWKQLGCGPVYTFSTGTSEGFLGGIGSFCPDSPDGRAHLYGKLIFFPGYCETALGVPDGKIFVFWKTYEKPQSNPSCPSGCPGAGIYPPAPPLSAPTQRTP